MSKNISKHETAIRNSSWKCDPILIGQDLFSVAKFNRKHYKYFTTDDPATYVATEPRGNIRAAMLARLTARLPARTNAQPTCLYSLCLIASCWSRNIRLCTTVSLSSGRAVSIRHQRANQCHLRADNSSYSRCLLQARHIARLLRAHLLFNLFYGYGKAHKRTLNGRIGITDIIWGIFLKGKP